MPSAYHLGRGLRIVAVDEAGADLEGSCRLAPGRVIVLFGVPPRPSLGRHLFVSSWRVVRAGADGMAYRGRGEWRAGKDGLPVRRPGTGSA